MPDIREQTLLDQLDASRFAVMRTDPLRARIRLAIRRLVVMTSVAPLSYLYVGIYKLHLKYALRVLSKFPGVHSIYVTGGMTSGDMVPGISDIDLVVVGKWNDEQQMRVSYAMRRLSALSPLYDAQLGGNAHTISSLITMYETDYFFQFRLNLGRTRWKRIYGEDLFTLLPPLAPEKVAGGYYSEVRLWWEQFVDSAFGFGVTSRDEIFRNSIAYKTVVGIQKMDLALQGSEITGARKEVIQAVINQTSDAEEKGFLLRLQRSADHRFLNFEGNAQEQAFRYLIGLMERIHQRLPGALTFQPLPEAVDLDASAADMMICESSHQHLHGVVSLVSKEWPGYISASVVPSLSFFYPDDLVLMIEVNPSKLPTVDQIRELCRRQLEAAPGLRQRVALFLLLPHGAYQLEILSSAEFWHHTLCQPANPEVFALLGRPEFLIDGTTQRKPADPVWTRFASDQVAEEITVRRSAFSKAAEAAGTLRSVDLLRNLWRQVQLEIIYRSAESGTISLPLTVPAMLRTLKSWGLPEDSVFTRLADGYRSEMDGVPVDAHAMLPEVMELLVMFQ
ncbi:MAG TPA: nucleotidyltransferase domain-containing protein [Acidisarcina sp.]